jgi:hypothetical protein
MTPEELFTAALGLGRQWRVIQAVAMDMSPAYVKGATEHFPHVMPRSSSISSM